MVVTENFDLWDPGAPVLVGWTGVAQRVSDASGTKSDQTLPVVLAQDTPPKISTGHNHLWIDLQRPAFGMHHGSGQGAIWVGSGGDVIG